MSFPQFPLDLSEIVIAVYLYSYLRWEIEAKLVNRGFRLARPDPDTALEGMSIKKGRGGKQSNRTVRQK